MSHGHDRGAVRTLIDWANLWAAVPSEGRLAVFRVDCLTASITHVHLELVLHAFLEGLLRHLIPIHVFVKDVHASRGPGSLDREGPQPCQNAHTQSQESQTVHGVLL